MDSDNKLDFTIWGVANKIELNSKDSEMSKGNASKKYSAEFKGKGCYRGETTYIGRRKIKSYAIKK